MTQLNAVEARVVGALMEKEVTTPEYYPLSLNALVNACNQKSSRDPVMELSEVEVRGALFALEELGLVRTLADGRVSKFENRTRDGWSLRRDEFAVISLLLLRGPQTAAELRARAERLYSFDDNAAVQATLERLAARQAPLEPMTRLLPRQPGAREARWMQLLSGPGGEAAALAEAGTTDREEEQEPGMQARVQALEELVRSLEERVRLLEAGLGAGDE